MVMEEGGKVVSYQGEDCKLRVRRFQTAILSSGSFYSYLLWGVHLQNDLSCGRSDVHMVTVKNC